MFHALCWNCADCFIGKNWPARNQDAWQQAYRAVEHGEARKRCSRMEIRNFPEVIQSFADSFVFLQEKRHMADYDPVTMFTRHEVLTAIDLAEDMIRELQGSNIRDKRAFSVWKGHEKKCQLR